MVGIIAARIARMWVLGAAFSRLAEQERDRLALWLPVCLGAGVLAYFTLLHEPPAWSGAAMLGLAGVGAALAPAFSARRRLLTALAALGAGVLAAQAATWRAPPLEPLPARAVVVSGTVRLVETMPDSAQRVTIARPGLPGQAAVLARDLRVRLRPDDPARPEPGDTVSVRALLRSPGPPALPGGWDWQRDAFFAGVAGTGRALGPATIEPAPEAGIAARLEHLREAVAARFRAGIPGGAGTIAAAFFTGFQSAIPRPDIAAFRDSGLAHLLSASGLHVAAVIGFVFGLVRLALALSEHAALHWPCKQIAALAGLAAAALYTPLTGAEVPMLRSLAMAALVVLGILAGRRAISLRSLGLAATAVLLVSPAALPGPSFQMSFAAVLALIAGHEAARPWLLMAASHGGWGRRLALRVGGALFTSLLAGAATAPFGIYHFGRAQSWFMLANLLAVPLTGLVIMPLGLLALVLMPLGLDWLALAPMGRALGWLLRLAHAAAALPAATSDIPFLPDWGLGCFTLGLLWLCLWRGRLRRLGIPLILAGLAAPWLARPADILVSSDARLLAMRTPSGVFAQAGSGASPLTLESWGRYWAAVPTGKELQDAVPHAIACSGDTCRLGASGEVLFLRRGGEPADGACAGIRLVIAVEPLRQDCPGAARIDRFTVWREGAQAIWLEPDGVRVLSDRAVRGDRPWVELPPRRRPDLPPARDE